MKKEHEKLLQKFKRCIDERDLRAMDNNLYTYLNNYCSFIAHYNISGFKQYYQDEKFLIFVDHFINPPFGLPLTYTSGIPEQDEVNTINQEMINYVTKHLKQIKFEFENKEYSRKIKLLKQLAEEVGYEVKPKGTLDVMDLDTIINEDGQLALI
ncbi:hypothetical protein QTG56_24760 (plasmid) [Rossellomorea sp. AcN35-11]|nr:hypothetical protein [Rossellomorea aquimaris]WJV31847.1 hypothetical protein QTG56_24760 [Rossellomorea sp. AcN35-11]